MNKDKMVAFIRAKTKLQAEHGAGMSRSNEVILAAIESGKLPASALLQMDRDLDDFFRPSRDAKAVRGKLIAAFGFASLSKSPERIVRQVLRRGAIRQLAEARVVRDFLSSSPEGEEEDLPRLESLLAAWERTAPKE